MRKIEAERQPGWGNRPRPATFLGPRNQSSAVNCLACCDLRQKCYDPCCDLDLKNHSVLPTLLRRCDLQGGSHQVRRRPRFLVTDFSNLKPKIDPNLLPIPGLTFCNRSKLEILCLG
jgi:hypothetical protein